MAWCPKCKLEYRDGITVCADCGGELVDHFEEEKELSTIMSTESEALAQKFLEFLNYSTIYSAVMTFEQEMEEYTISVEQRDVKEAKKLFKAFFITESEDAETSDLEEKNKGEENKAMEDADDEISLKSEKSSHSSGVYVKREDKYKDLSSTATIFYIFGVGGLVFIALNFSGFINFVQGTFSYVIYTIMFLGCLFVGFVTQKSAKETKKQIAEERDLTDSINAWLSTNITEESLKTMDDETVSEEANYLNRTNHIKKQLLSIYEGLDDSYADQLIEDYYNDNF